MQRPQKRKLNALCEFYFAPLREIFKWTQRITEFKRGSQRKSREARKNKREEHKTRAWRTLRVTLRLCVKC
jgi:hypothetical protein